LGSSVFGGSNRLSNLLQAGENLFNDVWQLSFARTLAHLGNLQLQADKQGAFFLCAGVIAAVGIVWASSRKQAKNKMEPTPIIAGWRAAAALLLALLAGLFPVVVMGRFGNGREVDTRFWLPVLPIAACLTTYLISSLTKQRFTLGILLILSFLCGHTIAKDAYGEVHAARTARSWGRTLHSKMSAEGINVAFIVYDVTDTKKCEPIELSYELTARMTERWPTKDRNRFWVWAAPLWGNEVPDPPEEIDVKIRGVERKGVVSKYFWLSIDERGGVRRLLERTPRGDHWIRSTQ